MGGAVLVPTLGSMTSIRLPTTPWPGGRECSRVGASFEPEWPPGEGVRGIGGQGSLTHRTRGATGIYGKGGIAGGHGVVGVSGVGDGAGTKENSGVVGFSEQNGRGATFVAGKPSIGTDHITDVNHEVSNSRPDVVTAEGIAQVRLVPSMNFDPPSSGRIGDLFARSNNGAKVGLFLCVESSRGSDDGPDQPAKWREVQLSPDLVTGI